MPNVGAPKLLFAVLLFICFQNAYGQVTSTTGGGNWNTGGTWIGGIVPGVGQAVVIDGPVTLDINTPNIASLTINAAKTFTTTAARTVTVTGAITVNGTYSNGSTGAIAAGSIAVNGGATYVHAIDGGTIPTATWAASSNCNITGITATAPVGFGQNFGNFTWNSTGQTADIYMQSNVTVQGDFTIANSGLPINAANHALRMSNTATGYTIGVTGNLIVGSNGAFKMNNNTGSCAINVGGNFNLNGGNFTLVTGASNSTVSVTGDVSISGGTLELQEDPSAVTGTLNVTGNFTNTGGTVDESGGGVGLIVFNKAGTQTYSSAAGLVTNTVNFTVNNGTTLQMAAPATVVDGGGTFLLSAGATLGVTSPGGITTAGATGNIQTTTRTYTAGANYIYNGSANQAVGNGLTASTPGNLTINNPGNIVSLGVGTSISGNLNVTTGTLATNNFALSLAGAKSLTVSLGATLTDGTTSISWGGAGGSANINGTFQTANTAGFSAAAGAAISSTNNPTITLGGSSTVEYTVATGGQTISGRTYDNLTLDNTSATNTAGGNLTVNGTLITTAGGVLDMGTANILGGTLTTIINGGTIKTSVPTATSSTPLATGKTWGGTIEYTRLTGLQTVVGGTYNILLLDNTSAANSAGGSLTVNGTLTTTAGGTLDMGVTSLLGGTLTTITNGGTIKTSVPTATSNVPIPSGKTWGGTIEYGALTGLQTVVAATYNNLQLDNTSGANTAGGSLTVNGTLTTTAGGTLDMGATSLLGGTLTTITNGGTIKTSVPTATSNVPIPGGKTWGGTIEYGALTGLQTVVAATYNNLQLDNTSGANTAGGSLTVNGTLTTTAGGTLDMGATSLLGGTLTTITNGGTIKTSVPTVTSNVPIPSGKTWGGTIEYGALAGSQTVVTATYNNLQLDNTSGTNTAGGSLTVNGTLTTTAGGTLDMGAANLLSGTLTTIANGGKIKTSVPTATSNIPIPSGKTWGGTIEYGALAGLQTIVSGTYTNLLLDNTSGTNIPGGSLTANVVTATAGGTLDMGSNSLAAATFNNTGATVKFSGASNGLAISTGTVEYYGASQTVVAGTYNNLIINQSSGEAILGGPVTVNGILTLSAGNLNLGGNNLILGSSATISVAGPSASKMIIASGGSEVRKTFTANGSFTFPIGDNTGVEEYSPVTISVTGSGYSSAYIGASVVDSKHPSNASSTNFLTR